MAKKPAKSAKAKKKGGSTGVSFDFLTLLGVTLAVGAILGGNWLEGGHISALLQLTAFVIVIGGTFGAVLIQTPLRDFRGALGRLRWVLLPPAFDREAVLGKTIEWSRIARRDGLLALEERVGKEPDNLTQKGLQLLVDGLEPEAIRTVMDVEIDNALAKDARAAKVYEAMGGYSPTIGIIGAVLGLIDVMNNLSDPTQLGAGIAVAFVATIYGVGFANLLYLPIANKLRAVSGDQMQYHEMVVDGIAMIADGDNPQTIQNKLEGYLD
ncbi:flagellar motor protein [Congregibacter litoralis]|uniref:Flagellar motor component n=1 Tax=Congregibacter litoralis KT71 TaxID=314285 RepID=A4A5X8_9GAMM|nr:Flagellar motor component [Congregibacter litoralis KT71]